MTNAIKFKRLLAKTLTILLLVTMIGTTFVGCGTTEKATTGDNTTTGENTTTATTSQPAKPASWISDEPVTFTFAYKDNPATPFNKDWLVFSELAKRSNVTLQCDVIPNANNTGYNDKLKLLFASGDMPDIMSVVSPSDYQEYDANGLFIDSSDYLEKMPFMKAAFDKYPDAYKEWVNNYTTGTGKRICFPQVGRTPVQDVGMFIREDLVKKYGLQDPKSFDELYTYLKMAKEENTKRLPLNVRYGFDCFNTYSGIAFNNTVGSWWAASGVFYDSLTTEGTNKYKSSFTGDNYKALLKYDRKLMQEGLLDPEAFTQQDSQFEQKMTNGISVAAYMWAGQEISLNEAGKKIDPNFELKMLPPLSALGAKAIPDPKVLCAQGWLLPASVANKPYFDKLLKFVDWYMYSDEARILFSWGVEGVTFETKSDGTRDWLPEFKLPNGKANSDILGKKYGLGVNSFDNASMEDALYSNMSDNVVAITKYCKDNNLFVGGGSGPTPKFTPDQAEIAKTITAPLYDLGSKWQQEFIFGKKDIDKDWDEYLKQLEAKKNTELVNMYNDALK